MAYQVFHIGHIDRIHPVGAAEDNQPCQDTAVETSRWRDPVACKSLDWATFLRELHSVVDQPSTPVREKTRGI